MPILNMTGGSTGQSISVVGGLAQPVNPKDNTIWVNTSTPITGYRVSDALFGADIIQGNVFVRTRSGQPSEPYAFVTGTHGKSRQAIVQIVSSKQYENGAWKEKLFRVYRDGAWHDSGVILYSLGAFPTPALVPSVTFGRAGNANTSGYGYEANAIRLWANFSNAEGRAYFYTPLIDFTAYSTLTIQGWLSGNTAIKNAGVTDQIDISYNSPWVAYATFPSSATTTLQINVSQVTGQHRIGVVLMDNTSAASKQLDIYEIKLN